MSHLVDAHVAYIKTISDLNQDKAELLERIKRLEEAGDKIVEAGWSVQDWSGMCVVWAKAKEAKP